MPIDVLWEAYIFIIVKGWRDKQDRLEMCDWQWKDTNDFLTTHKQIYLDWCRFSGKTEKGSLLAVFFTILGMEVLWLTKATNQFMRVQRLWNKNPFVSFHKANRMRKEIQLITGDLIGLDVLLTEENCSGPHPKVLIYDEFALLDIALMQKANLMLGPDPWILYISTPKLGSPTTIIRKTIETRTHTYLDCKWKNPKDMEKLKIKGMEWMWDQDMMCKEILPKGAVFPNIIETFVFPAAFDRIQQGVDYNGALNNNPLVRIGWYNGQLYALKEEAFQYKIDDQLLQQRCLEYPTEAECGGWNDTFAPNLHGVTKHSFDENRGELKIERIKQLLAQIIFVDPQLCPHLLDDIRHAFWGDDQKIDTRKLHYLSALMHAIGAAPRYLPPESNAMIKNEIKREVEARRGRIMVSR